MTVTIEIKKDSGNEVINYNVKDQKEMFKVLNKYNNLPLVKMVNKNGNANIILRG